MEIAAIVAGILTVYDQEPAKRRIVLQEFDLWPIKIGPFYESGVVPLVLAPIWVLYGYLYPLLDEVYAGDGATEEARERASKFSTVAFTWALAAAQFILSDVLYLQGWPHWQVCLLLK